MGVSRNTNEIVGIAEDAFNENILMREIKDINESLESDEKTLPDFALNFMVFIATTWHTTGKIQFLVARYGRKTLTGSWLYEKVHDITPKTRMLSGTGRCPRSGAQISAVAKISIK